MDWVDGVVAAKTGSEQPLRPFPFIAKTKEELFSAIGSKYCPVPTNITLREILDNDGKYIVIGLPCQIESLRKASSKIKKLDERTQLCFGLACNHSPTFNATKYLLRKNKIPEENVTSLTYRNGGWPGKMCIKTLDGRELKIASSNTYYWGLVFHKFFWTNRCILCEDKLAASADISFMDAWLKEFASDKTGISLIMVRTKKGKELVDKAVQEKIVHLVPIPVVKILNAQLIYKFVKEKAAVKYVYQLIFHKNISSHDFKSSFNVLDLLQSFHFIMLNGLSRNYSPLSLFIIDYNVVFLHLIDYIKKILKNLKH
jgi:coenzyme F420 hydrogenase subunit beta